MQELEQTKMVAKQASQTKMVKIKCLRDFRVVDEKGVEKIYRPGEVGHLTEEQAKEFCDTEFESYFPYRGERFLDDGPQSAQGKVKRAERV